MKTIVLVLLLAVTFAHYTEIEKVTLFNEWQMVQNKQYYTEEVEWFRFQIFCQNLEVADRLNLENPEATFTMNQFADLTNEEFVLLYTGYTPSDSEEKNYADFTFTDAPPAAWDWTDKDHNAVTPIKNQGQCGSCWAFSTTGNLEGQTFVQNQNLMSLSEQQLVDCDKNDEGCNGGLMDNAFKWLKANGGIMKESDYPYRGVKQACKFDASKAVVQVESWVDIKQGDEASMVDSLFNHGPLAIAINANPLQLYSGGIFDPIYCSKKLDHGVLAVAYGTENGKDFWKVKNSWGASWGERGFFRIIRGKNMCGLAQAVSTVTIGK